MSRQRARDAIAGVMTDRIPQWDLPDHPDIARQLLDYDIWEDTERTAVDLWKHFDIDLIHCVLGGIAEWNFPLVRYYGEADYVDHPSVAPYRRAYPKPSHKPYTSMYDELGMTSSASYLGLAPTMAIQHRLFSDPDEVLDFHPLEHDHATRAERAAFFKTHYADKQARVGASGQYVGWYYHTLFMWPVEVFNWENFMVAAMTDPARFDEILRDFFELTKRDIAAMCEVGDLPAICCHDDLCSANGPMFSPDWYRTHIYPAYEEIFDLIHRAGKKVIYVCDGNLMPILDDLHATGMDGVAVDGCCDLATIKKRFSGKIMVGGMPASTLAMGSTDDIARMVAATADLMRDEPGYFFQCVAMNGSTPPDNVLAYQRAVAEFGARP
jgi:hypothetical protein